MMLSNTQIITPLSLVELCDRCILSFVLSEQDKTDVDQTW